MLEVSVRSDVRAHNGGLAVTRGRGGHPTRSISTYELMFVRAGMLHTGP